MSTDRQWMPPTKHEMVRAIKELKDAAPGTSGIQSCVWKAILAEEGNIEIRPSGNDFDGDQLAPA